MASDLLDMHFETHEGAVAPESRAPQPKYRIERNEAGSEFVITVALSRYTAKGEEWQRSPVARFTRYGYELVAFGEHIEVAASGDKWADWQAFIVAVETNFGYKIPYDAHPAGWAKEAED